MTKKNVLVGLVTALIGLGCSDESGSVGADGTGGASSSTTSGSGGSGGNGGSDGSGGAGGSVPTDEETLRTYRTCDEPDAVGALPAENGQIALGKFIPTQTPFEAKSFTYALNVGSFGPVTCEASPHHVVAFVAAENTEDGLPPQDARLLTFDITAPTEGEQTVIFPETITVSEGEALYAGVVMASEDTQTLCVRSCADFLLPDRSFWSSQALAETQPASWDWLKLSESPTPATGVKHDLKFEVFGVEAR